MDTAKWQVLTNQSALFHSRVGIQFWSCLYEINACNFIEFTYLLGDNVGQLRLQLTKVNIRKCPIFRNARWHRKIFDNRRSLRQGRGRSRRAIILWAQTLLQTKTNTTNYFYAYLFIEFRSELEQYFVTQEQCDQIGRFIWLWENL